MDVGVDGVRRRPRALGWGSVGVVVLAAGLTGCTGSDAPDPGISPHGVATASAAPSPTPSPSGPSAPVRPAQIDQMTPTGAAAAATYFIELYGYVLQTGDLTEWDAMSFRTCTFCSTTHEFVASTIRDGGSFVGGTTTAEVLAVHDLAELEGGYPVDLRVTQGPTSRLDATGTQVTRTDGSVASARFHTTFVDGAWRILGVEGESESE